MARVTERLVVVGGDAAGMSAAAGARRRRTVDELEIVAFERGRFTSYAACGVPYFVGDLVHEPEDLIARSPEEHRRMGVDVHLRHEVVAIDTGARRVTVRALDEGSERDEPYDQLVIATGGTPRKPPLPGLDAEGVYGVQTLEDGIEVRRIVDETKPQHAVVVGGGDIGGGMAEALLRRGLGGKVGGAAPAPLCTRPPG